MAFIMSGYGLHLERGRMLWRSRGDEVRSEARPEKLQIRLHSLEFLLATSVLQVTCKQRMLANIRRVLCEYGCGII